MSSKKIFFILSLVVLLALILFLPAGYHRGDMGSWQFWTAWIDTYGLENIYSFGTFYPAPYRPNYPPLFLYFLWVFGKFIPGEVYAFEQIQYVRIIPMFFDWALIWLPFLLVPKNRRNYYWGFFLLLNIGYWYNSVWWGQCDAIFIFFSFLSLLLLVHQKAKWALIAYILALNAKLQAIIFLPLIALLWILQIKSWRELAKNIGAVIITQFIILLPFILNGQLNHFYELVLQPVDYYTNISLKAYNLWYLILGESALWKHDPALWGPLSYKSWGRLFFMGSGALVFLPLFLKIIKNGWSLDLTSNKNRQLLFLVATLIPLIFFFFNTQMHERYAQAGLIMGFAFGLLSGRWWIFILYSLAVFLNLEEVLDALGGAERFPELFHFKTIAWIFAGLVLLSFLELYRLAFFVEEDRE